MSSGLQMQGRLNGLYLRAQIHGRKLFHQIGAKIRASGLPQTKPSSPMQTLTIMALAELQRRTTRFPSSKHSHLPLCLTWFLPSCHTRRHHAHLRFIASQTLLSSHTQSRRHHTIHSCHFPSRQACCPLPLPLPLQWT